tara:strand:+ start:4562 stop:5311 length:750 start_codon:yes stop_codon:yes gene_type:complete
MSYKELFEKTKEVNKTQNVLFKSSLFEFLFRKISFFVTPFFIKLCISPNIISGIGLVLGLMGSSLIFFTTDFSIRLSFAFFFIASVIDFVDGNVARMTNKSSFYGRFIDGIIDIIILSIYRFALCYYIVANIGVNFLFWVGVTACIITPFHHLIYDRFSSYARWSNEENDTNILPYIRRKVSAKAAFFLVDLQLLIFFLIPFFISSSLIEFLFLVYFITIILSGFHAIFSHIIYSYKTMNFAAKSGIHD